MNSLIRKIEGIEKEEIIKALKESKWVKAKAARWLGITERMIDYKIKKYGIKQKKMGQAG
ncbi:MAG: helix-turn-helix domain-containing protein [Nitrospirota bacterium]